MEAIIFTQLCREILTLQTISEMKRPCKVQCRAESNNHRWQSPSHRVILDKSLPDFRRLFSCATHCTLKFRTNKYSINKGTVFGLVCYVIASVLELWTIIKSILSETTRHISTIEFLRLSVSLLWNVSLVWRQWFLFLVRTSF